MGYERFYAELAALLGEPRDEPLVLAEPLARARGGALPPAITAWAELLETTSLELPAPARTALCLPDVQPSLAAHWSHPDGLDLGAMIAALMGATVLATREELSYLATWTGEVHHFHPEDWGLWPAAPSWPELLSRLLALELPGRACPVLDAPPAPSPDRAPPIAVRFARAEWITGVLVGLDHPPRFVLSGLEAELDAERSLLPHDPALTTTWLWLTALTRSPGYAQVAAAARQAQSALVRESLHWSARLYKGEVLGIGGRTSAEIYAAVAGQRASGRAPIEEEARRVVAERERFDKQGSPEALLELFAEGGPVALELAAILLERTRYSAANYELVSAAALAAERHRWERALPGLARAVAAGIGRLEGGQRLAVVRAYVALGGDQARQRLRALVEEREARRLAAPDPEGSYWFFMRDVCAWLVPLLEAGDAPAFTRAADLLRRFARELAPGSRPRLELLWALLTLLEGAAAAPARLAEELRPLTHPAAAPEERTQAALRAVAERAGALLRLA